MAAFDIPVDGGSLHGIEQGNGLPVVFLHAGVCDHRMWLSQFEALDENIHAIAYDRRGFGKTQSENVEFSELDDLSIVLDHFGIRAAVLVGCSMGGALAIDYALAYPDRVAGMVLVGSALTGAPDFELPEEMSPVLQAADVAREMGDPDMLNSVQAHHWLDGPLQQSGRVGGEIRQLFYDMNMIALRAPELEKEIVPPPAHDKLSSVTQPALLICGSFDSPDILEIHQVLEDELPNAVSIMIEGTAHLPNFERPDLFNPFLSQFLGSY
ncbi:alpha/beta fold hydrolase [Maritalea porphyrae]|uniref:Alpha/beta hydrolase n=1 Tax=Maritalea porphyrae TaxID=880732 RepID=A0ABQ5UX75_9HYPH|nr:alpha/beta hydrolase [Maritalea porphyrae]GLQ18989.1 alpha/beta hydrolase [Maritalea porphyrae]